MTCFLRLWTVRKEKQLILTYRLGVSLQQQPDELTDLEPMPASNSRRHKIFTRPKSNVGRFDMIAWEHAPAVEGDLTYFAVTNDRDALGDDSHLAHSFEKAWFLVGKLIYDSHVTVNFNNPEWVRTVMSLVESMAEEISYMRQRGD